MLPRLCKVRGDQTAGPITIVEYMIAFATPALLRLDKINRTPSNLLLTALILSNMNAGVQVLFRSMQNPRRPQGSEDNRRVEKGSNTPPHVTYPRFNTFNNTSNPLHDCLPRAENLQALAVCVLFWGAWTLSSLLWKPSPHHRYQPPPRTMISWSMDDLGQLAAPTVAVSMSTPSQPHVIKSQQRPTWHRRKIRGPLRLASAWNHRMRNHEACRVPSPRRQTKSTYKSYIQWHSPIPKMPADCTYNLSLPPNPEPERALEQSLDQFGLLHANAARVRMKSF